MDSASKPTRSFLASATASLPPTWQTNMNQSNIRPATSLPPNAHFMHSNNFARSHEALFLNAYDADVTGYTSIYPGCEVPGFLDEAALDQNTQQHYDPYFLSHDYITRAHDAFTSNAYHGATLSGTPHVDHFTGFYNHPPALTSPSLAFSTSTPASNIPTTTSNPASPLASKRYHCTHPGCDVSVKNAADLTRHAKKHEDGPKDYGCPIRDCPREGVRGFARKDKLNDHLKAKHKMSFIG